MFIALILSCVYVIEKCPEDERSLTFPEKAVHRCCIVPYYSAYKRRGVFLPDIGALILFVVPSKINLLWATPELGSKQVIFNWAGGVFL